VCTTLALLAHGVRLTPQSASAKGWLSLGLASVLGLIALIELFRKRRTSAIRFLIPCCFLCWVGLCLFATAAACARGFGLLGVFGIWISFGLVGILAETVLTLMIRNKGKTEESGSSKSDGAARGGQ
jgi:hypothetical protein